MNTGDVKEIMVIIGSIFICSIFAFTIKGCVKDLNQESILKVQLQIEQAKKIK
jgi:hypothetical protein